MSLFHKQKVKSLADAFWFFDNFQKVAHIVSMI